MNAPPPFTPAEIARAHEYHRPLYRALVLGIALGVGSLALLAWWRPGLSLPWWLEGAALAALAVVLGWVVRLPLGVWRHRYERRWEFSTQSPRGWFGDQLKGLAIAALISALLVELLVVLAHAYPSWWPLIGAVAAALFVLLLGFVAPVVLEPLFNRFEPLEDEGLSRELRSLAERAGVPVREVLVADASRRTRKVNAYVSGIGRTRRVVVWDTLLDAGPAELGLVVAHELAHRRYRHVAWLTGIGMAGAAAFVVVIWLVLGRVEPRDAAAILLVSSVLELLAAPFSAWLSRRWERAADRFSIELTGDRAAFRAAQLRLARTNLSDLDPPRVVYLWFFSHPTPSERLSLAS
jgi:Zn-dependent protease with chaperone function